jgi:hypothetical protein
MFASACGAQDGKANEETLTNGGLAKTTEALVAGQWVNSPGNGVMTGNGGGRGPLPVCRANYDGGQQPGKVWAGYCNFGWGGVSHYAALTDNTCTGSSACVKVLLAQSASGNAFRWQNAGYIDGYGNWNTNMPSNAVDGGDAGNAAGHVRLGVCQVHNYSDGTWHPGKYYANKCNYAWGGSPPNPGGQEIAATPNAYGDVQILVQ